MKIVVTGSLGNIGKPLAQRLIKQGHSVTVISSNLERQKEIETLGAKPAIGKMQDVNFLSATFKDADVVYCMETNSMADFFNPDMDIIAHYAQIGKNYK